MRITIIHFPFYYGWVIVAVSFMILIINYGIWWSFPMFYISILNEFGWSRAATAAIFTGGSMVYGFGSLVAGALIDKLGPRKLFPSACIILALGCFINSVSKEIWHFSIGYILMGMGVICTGYVPIAVILSKWFVKRIGTALGIALSGNVAPPLLAIPIHFLISTTGWRASYAVLASFVLILIVPLAAIFMRARPQEFGLEPDNLQKTLEDRGKQSPSTRTLQIVNKEWTETDWGLSKGVKTYQLWLLVVFMTALGIGVGIIMNHQGALMIGAGHSQGTAASIFTFAGLMAAIGRLGGFLADRLGREVAQTIDTALYVSSTLFLFLVTKTRGPWPLYLYAITFGLAYGLHGPTISSVAADLFAGRGFGIILGFANIGFGVGQGIGAWLGGMIFDDTGNYSLALWVAVSMFVLMSLSVWFAAPRKVKKVVRFSSTRSHVDTA